VLYLYAITEHPAPALPAQPGLDDAPLLAIDAGPVAGVASELAGAPPPPGEEALWRHEAVAEALMADRPVLPVRFGTAFASEAEVRSELTERAEPLAAALRRVTGHVEMGVRARLSGPGEDAAAPESGTAYVQARLEIRRRAESEADAVHVPLAALATASVRRLRDRPVPMLAGAYLVPEGRVPEFTAAVDRLAAEQPEARLVCTGPWPPYSFAEGLDA
jgi:hypothetical protein